ncbi:hypothetical protein E2C01_087228 [Portunus trituberculatus]|uniref:Uncharacterized protein n=1 Tax=Portunus trituberculatus TaxID=210409 RepID=A0A5B7JDI2_PORTR|nr:hypothetical protein [Portunus trituberculatus]
MEIFRKKFKSTTLLRVPADRAWRDGRGDGERWGDCEGWPACCGRGKNATSKV